jgi:prophage regulatory protein
MKVPDTSGTSRRSIDTDKPHPAAKFWRKRAVCTFYGFSPSNLDRKVKAGDFPAPVKLGPNTVAWLSAEVIAWGDARIAERDGVAA